MAGFGEDFLQGFGDLDLAFDNNMEYELQKSADPSESRANDVNPLLDSLQPMVDDAKKKAPAHRGRVVSMFTDDKTRLSSDTLRGWLEDDKSLRVSRPVIDYDVRVSKSSVEQFNVGGVAPGRNRFFT